MIQKKIEAVLVSGILLYLIKHFSLNKRGASSIVLKAVRNPARWTREEGSEVGLSEEIQEEEMGQEPGKVAEELGPVRRSRRGLIPSKRYAGPEWTR